MKKNLTILTGIALLITILIAGGCKSADEDDNTNDSRKVTIYLKKVVKIDGKTHLEMYNSYATEQVVVDSLRTFVQPGMKIIWAPETDSGIKIVNKIGSSTGNGNIFDRDASRVFLSKKFKFKVPDGAFGEEKYDIQIEDMEGQSWNIDPHLIIPDRR